MTENEVIEEVPPVCICGHSINKHVSTDGEFFCMDCLCGIFSETELEVAEDTEEGGTT